MSVNWGQTSLTLAQLKQDYRTAVRILRAEKALRQQVFRQETSQYVFYVSIHAPTRGAT